MSIIILLISFILDGYLSTLIPISSYFIPLLTLSALYMIFPTYKKRTKRYQVLVIISGIIYDLLYTNLLFLHAIVFYILSYLIIWLHKNYKHNYLKDALYLILIIAIYETLIASILFIFQITTVTISMLAIKILKSLIINIFYIQILKLLLKKA